MTKPTTAPPATSALVPLGETWTGPREVIKVGEYDRSKVNVLIPGSMAVQINPYLVPMAREVRLDPDPVNGDVFPLSQRKVGDRWVATALGIAAVGLFTLSNVAGILEVPQGSGRVDDGSDPGVCTYRATMVMRLPDGQWLPKVRECTVKLVTLAKEIRALKAKKAEEYKWNDQRLEAEIAKELLLKEKFLERLAETGAKTRCIRAMLSIRGKYTPEQIARPFVVAGVVTDMSRPEMQQLALQQAAAVIPALFGPTQDTGPAAPRQLLAGPSAEDLHDPDPEPASELTGDELAGQMGPRAPEDDEPIEGQSHEVGEPSWFDAATAAPTPPAAVPAGPSPTEQLVTLLREKATRSGIVGGATLPQKASLRQIFTPLGLGATAAGLRIVFGLAELGHITGAQAQALIDVAVDAEFADLWRELVTAEGAQAA